MTDWQSPAAITVVLLTVITFIARLRRGKKSCGSGSCACPKDSPK